MKKHDIWGWLTSVGLSVGFSILFGAHFFKELGFLGWIASTCFGVALFGAIMHLTEINDENEKKGRGEE